MRPADAKRVPGIRHGLPDVDLYLWVGGEPPLGQWVTFQWEAPGHGGAIVCCGSTPGGDIELGERFAVCCMRETREESKKILSSCSECGRRVGRTFCNQECRWAYESHVDRENDDAREREIMERR